MNKLVNVFNVIFIAIFGWILVIATINMAHFHWGFLILVLVFIGLAFLLVKFLNYRRITYNKVWILLQVISLIVMILLALSLEVGLLGKNNWVPWDWSILTRTAFEYAKSGEIFNRTYYIKYSNNRFWAMCLMYFAAFLKSIFKDMTLDQFKMVTLVLGCLFTQLTIFFMHKVADIMWGARKAFFMGILALCFVPFYMYSQFFYTDSPAMLLAIIAFLCYFMIRDGSTTKKIVFSVLLGIFAGLIYEIKIMLLVIIVAMIIDALVKIPKWSHFFICTAIVAVVMIGTVAFGNVLTQNTFKITEAEKDRYEVPPTHYVMMGLKDFGGFDIKDVLYTDSFDTKQKKIDANVKTLQKRLEDRGVGGTMNHLFITKMKRTWGEPTLAGCDYIARLPKHSDWVPYKIFAKDGEFNLGAWYYQAAFWFLLLLGVVLSGIDFRRARDQRVLVFKIALFGIMLLMLIWECNSRYLLPFVPIIIMTATHGLVSFKERIFRKR